MMRPRLGIVAGGGMLPGVLIKNCKRETRDFVVIALKGQTHPATVGDCSHKWIRLGAAGEALAFLQQQKVEELVFAGSVNKPAAADLRPDLWTARFLARGNIYRLGDDGLLRRLIKHLELEEGLRVVEVTDIAPELLASSGTLTRVKPTEADLADIAVTSCTKYVSGHNDLLGGLCVVNNQKFVEKIPQKFVENQARIKQKSNKRALQEP